MVMIGHTYPCYLLIVQHDAGLEQDWMLTWPQFQTSWDCRCLVPYHILLCMCVASTQCLRFLVLPTKVPLNPKSILKSTRHSRKWHKLPVRYILVHDMAWRDMTSIHLTSYHITCLTANKTRSIFERNTISLSCHTLQGFECCLT